MMCNSELTRSMCPGWDWSPRPCTASWGLPHCLQEVSCSFLLPLLPMLRQKHQVSEEPGALAGQRSEPRLRFFPESSLIQLPEFSSHAEWCQPFHCRVTFELPHPGVCVFVCVCMCLPSRESFYSDCQILETFKQNSILSKTTVDEKCHLPYE